MHGKVFIYFGLIIRFLQGIGCAATETGATAMLAGRFPDSIGTVTGLMDVS
jgi:MFS family permease